MGCRGVLKKAAAAAGVAGAIKAAPVNVAGPEPRLTSLRDITRLGLPFKLQSETLEKPAEGAVYSVPRVFPSFHPKHG